MFIFRWKLLSCPCGAPFLMRGRVCHLSVIVDSISPSINCRYIAFAPTTENISRDCNFAVWRHWAFADVCLLTCYLEAGFVTLLFHCYERVSRVFLPVHYPAKLWPSTLQYKLILLLKDLSLLSTCLPDSTELEINVLVQESLGNTCHHPN
jgi:hypothetical protein